MQHLKMVAVVKVVLEVLEVLVDQIFQIFLRISLEILEVEEEVQEEVQITEALIWDMICQLHLKKLSVAKNKIYNFQLLKNVIHAKEMDQNQVLIQIDVLTVVEMEK